MAKKFADHRVLEELVEHAVCTVESGTSTALRRAVGYFLTAPVGDGNHNTMTPDMHTALSDLCLEDAPVAVAGALFTLCIRHIEKTSVPYIPCSWVPEGMRYEDKVIKEALIAERRYWLGLANRTYGHYRRDKIAEAAKICMQQGYLEGRDFACLTRALKLGNKYRSPQN